MEPSSQLSILNAQIRECYGRVAYSHKTHEKAADIYEGRNSSVKFWQIVLSAVTTTGILVSVFGDNKTVGIVSALVSVCLLGINTYLKKYDLAALANRHTDTAAKLWGIRESYLSLLADIAAETATVENVQERRDALQEQLHEVYADAPRTTSKAYALASKGLKHNEELTFSDEEIDQFLPRDLRRKSDL